MPAHMNCPLCLRLLGNKALSCEEVGISVRRHGTLYRCTLCGEFFELIAEERSLRHTAGDELKEFYPNVTALKLSQIPTTITKQQAEKLVYERINTPRPDWPDMPEMIILHTEERQSGFLVYWTSRLWRETGDIRHAVAGNGPYLVCKKDGTLFEVGSRPPIEERILDAERRLRAHLQSHLAE
jgi:hypothetical protein